MTNTLMSLGTGELEQLLENPDELVIVIDNLLTVPEMVV